MLILKGGKGNDTLVTGGYQTVLVGHADDETYDSGADTFRITSNKQHVLVGIGTTDKIQILSTATTPALTAADVSALTVSAVSATDTNPPPRYYTDAASTVLGPAPLKVNINNKMTLWVYTTLKEGTSYSAAANLTAVATFLKSKITVAANFTD